jgi:hypothetical protein
MAVETNSDCVGVQYEQNAQNLHRKEPRKGREGFEIDEDDRRVRFSESGGRR